MMAPEFADTPLRLSVLRQIGIEDDFLLTSGGKPRRLIGEEDFRTISKGGRCKNASALIERLCNLFVPPLGRRKRHPKWVRYAKVKRNFHTQEVDGKTRSTGVEKDRQWSTPSKFYRGRINYHIQQRRLWANLLLGRYGLGVSWSYEAWHDVILLDVDHYLANGDKADFYDLDPSRRLELIQPWVKAVRQLGEEAGEPLEPFVMASGGKGFWVQVFLSHAAHTNEIAELQRRIIELAKGHGAVLWPPLKESKVKQLGIGPDGEVVEIVRRLGRVRYRPGTVFANPESGLETFVCRVPLSIHQSEGFEDRIAQYLDPETGEFDPTILLRLRRSGRTHALLVALGIRRPDWRPGEPVFGQTPQTESVEPVVREAVEDGGTEDTATYSPPPTPHPSSIRGDTIGGRTVADLLLAIERGEPAINITSIETILPETISNKETQRLLIGKGRLAMALAWLHLHGMSDLETWTTVVESVLRSRMRGQRIEQRMGDIRNHIVCHHKKMVSGDWKPYLPVSFTAEDVTICESLAVAIVGARAGKGRRRDQTTVRDILLAVIAESRRADEFKIIHNQWIELMGWIEPGLEHENPRLGNLRKKLSRYLKAITAYGLLTCTEKGSKGIPSTYAIHWDRWRPPLD